MLSSKGGAFLVKMTNVWGWNLRRPRSFPAPSLLFLRLGARYSEQNISKKEEKLRAQMELIREVCEW